MLPSKKTASKVIALLKNGVASKALSGRQFSKISTVTEDLDIQIFRQTYFGQEPLILKGLFKDLASIIKWPADEFHYLKEFGSKLVPVEISKGTASYASEHAEKNFERVEMPLQLFLAFLVETE